MLYPVTNKNRVAISLNGLWDFDFVDINYNANKKLNNPRQIGVPSSFNELFTTKEDRDFVGKVCYEKTLIHRNVHGAAGQCLYQGMATGLYC